MKKHILAIATMFVLCLCVIGAKTGQGQEAHARLFYDNFEHQKLDGWQTGGRIAIVRHDGNYRLTGIGSKSNGGLVRKGFEWQDYSYGIGVCLVRGHAALNFRSSLSGKYAHFLLLTQDHLELQKEDIAAGNSPQTLVRSEKGIPANTWTYIEIKLRGQHIQVYVDRELRVDYNDPQLNQKGTVGFEILPGAEAYFDEVEVTSVQ